jgi:hypothetical protein
MPNVISGPPRELKLMTTSGRVFAALPGVNFAVTPVC